MRIGKYNIKRRQGASFFSIVMKTVKFVLMMYVGGLILVQIASILNLSGNPFATAFTLLGFSGTDTVTIGSTGLISIVGILGAVYLVMQFVSVRKV